LLLHPLFRTLISLYQDDQERERAKSEGLEILKAAMRQTKSAQSAAASRISTSSSMASVERSARIDSDSTACGVDDSLFSLAHLFEQPELHPICAIEDELQRYFSSTISDSDWTLLLSDDMSGLVKFWLRKESEFPCITEASIRILAIPATQCSSERNISAAELAQPSRSSRLSPETLDAILYLRSKSLATQ
jgi:hAT family C-terminal dimerisation region